MNLRISIFLVLFVIFPFGLMSQSIEELEKLFKNEQDPGKKAYYGSVLAPVYSGINQNKYSNVERAIIRAKNTNDYGRLARSIFNLNNAISNQIGKIKVYDFKQGLELANKLSLKDAKLFMKLAEANYEAINEKYAEASRLYEELYPTLKQNYLKRKNDQFAKHNFTQLLNNIGFHYFKVGENDKAIEYSEELLYTVDFKKYPDEYAVVLSNVGSACINGKKYRKAIAYFRKSIEIIKKKKIQNQDNWNEYCLSLCYSRMRQFKKAEFYINNLKKCNDKLDINTFCGVEWELIYLEKSNLAILQEKYDIAEKYATKLNESKPLFFSDYQHAIVAKNLYKINRNKGNLIAAMNFLEEWKEYEDAYQESQNKTVRAFREKFFGLEKSVYQNKIVNKMEEEEQSATKRRQRVLIIVFSIIGLFLLVFAFYMYRLFYKLKQSTVQNVLYTEQMAVSLKEKEILLQEIHHRVKNNFQVISSLINLQANNLTDEAQIRPLMDAKNRVLSMSLVHQKLYSDSGNLGKINFGSFLTDIVGSMVDIYCNSPDDLSFTTNFDEVAVDLEKAVPLGLFCNEVITNCFKYGKRNSGKLMLHIDLKDHGAYQTELIIRDSGPGFPENRVTSTTSIGDRLKEILSQQLEGVLTEYNEMGAVVKLQFYNVPPLSRIKE